MKVVKSIVGETLVPYENETRLLPLTMWVTLYEIHIGRKISLSTVRKRRVMSKLGTMSASGMFMFTKEEFEKILKTPLPFCKNTFEAKGIDNGEPEPEPERAELADTGLLND
jgi:hypothetical protein